MSCAGSYASAYLFPQNVYFPVVPLSASFMKDGPSEVLSQLIRTYLVRKTSSIHETSLPPLPSLSEGPRKVYESHVLICTHNSRDTRCGIIGPIINKLFTQNLSSKGLLHPENPDESIRGKVRVGNISHIGGHKYAGNVIVWLHIVFL